MLVCAGIFNDAREVGKLAVHHFVHALHKAARHFVDQPHLLLGVYGHKLFQAFLDGRRRAGDDFLQAVGKAAVQILRHGLNQRGLLLLVDGDLRHRVYGEHARIAAHGAVEILQRVFG